MENRGSVACSVAFEGGADCRARTERIDINTLVIRADRRARYGERVTVRLGDANLEATVRWTTDVGFGVQLGSLRARDVHMLNRLSAR